MTAFGETKALAELDAEEWGQLCDRCRRCCLLKLEDTASGQVAYTAVACKLLDIERVCCTDYARRQRIADCLALDADLAAAIAWLPAARVYRLGAEGKPLPDWHPLVSGNPRGVRAAGISIAGRVISERFVPPAALV